VKRNPDENFSMVDEINSSRCVMIFAADRIRNKLGAFADRLIKVKIASTNHELRAAN
jgi:hypothetical protein